MLQSACKHQFVIIGFDSAKVFCTSVLACLVALFGALYGDAWESWYLWCTLISEALYLLYQVDKECAVELWILEALAVLSMNTITQEFNDINLQKFKLTNFCIVSHLKLH